MKQRLLVNLLVLLMIVIGFMSISNLNREAYPEVNFDMIAITTVYPGGSPDELEKLITVPIEKKLREVDGLDKVRSYNIENVSVIAVYIDDKAPDKPSVVDDVKDAVGLVTDLPEKAENPIVEELKIDKTQVIYAAIHAKKKNVPYKKLRQVADKFEDYIYDINGVAEVEDFGFYDREMLVEVNPSALTKYRIGMNTVIDKLRNRNVDLPGGPLRIGEDELVLRTKGQYEDTKEIANTAIIANDQGFVTRLSDIAKVTDTFEEPDVYERFNGTDSIVYAIWKKRSADEIKLADTIRESVKKFRNDFPNSVEISLFNDTSEITKNDIKSVLTNAQTGFVLLAMILFMLLGWRLALLITSSIPLVFMVAFAGMRSLGITINVVSLFGMIMVLGMIVDFGIVVSENAHRYIEMGLKKSDAIKKGTIEVFWPVTVTFMCICAAFAPLLFLSGLMGKFIYQIPAVLMICLASSWFTAFFILPAFLNIFTKEKKLNVSKQVKNKKNEMEDGEHFEKGLFGKFQKGYMKILTKALNHRYITALILFVFLILSISLVSLEFVKFVFMPGGGSERIEIKAKLPTSKNLMVNMRETKKIESIILKLKKDELKSLYSRVGIEVPFGLDPKPGEGTHKSTIKLRLTHEKDRNRTAAEIGNQLRKEFALAQKKKKITPDMNITVEVNENGPPIGKPVNIEIRGESYKTIKKIAREYIKYLHSIDGVMDITMDLEPGKEEYRYKINDAMAARTGVSVYDAALALNASFEGAVATSIRKGDDDIDIRVRFPEWARKKRKSLKDVMIANRTGGLIPLSAVTTVNKQPGYSAINRLNYKRLVQVQAQVDTKKITSVKINAILAKKFKNIKKRYPDYSIKYGGEKEETDESMGELGDYFVIALLVIFIILAVFMNSLLLPAVVMIAIPFALTGIIIALLVHGQPLSFMSVLGFFSLSGIIVSNTLVLVQFINNKRDEGLPLKKALIEGGTIRLRPIILTTGTTVLGLFPTIYGIGDKNYTVAPLALAFGYGLIFATIITLILVPCFYHIAEDIKKRTSIIMGKFGIKMNSSIYTPENTGSTTD